MRKETNVRQGFLDDEKYAAVRDALPSELRPLFVVAYYSGIRKGELLAIRWHQLDFSAGLITLAKFETKNKDARSIPILAGDMETLLRTAKDERDAKWPHSPWVFNRQGEPIKNFRHAWDTATKVAGVPDLQFHDLRRTALRNFRRAGVPQVVRMKIAGHLTDSMERRYNIVDGEDLKMAKHLMEQWTTVTKNVTTERDSEGQNKKA